MAKGRQPWPVADTELDILDNLRIYGSLKPVVYISRYRSGYDSARSFTGIIGSLLHHRLVHCRQEDDLAISRLGHGLHGFEVANLHSRGGREDVGSLF